MHKYSLHGHGKKYSVGSRITKIILKSLELAFFIGFVFTGAFAFFNLGKTDFTIPTNIFNPALMYAAGSFLIAWGAFAIPADVLDFYISAKEAHNDKLELTKEQMAMLLNQFRKELGLPNK